MITRKHLLPIIFIHIPKTAGSTLHQLVNHNCPTDSSYILGKPTQAEKDAGLSFTEIYKASLSRLVESSDETKEAIRVLFGHMTYGLHEHFRGGAQYATVLRHPISRIVSHFNFVMANPTHYLYERLVKNHASIESYVEATRALELNNGQVRSLFGDTHRSIPFGQCDLEMLKTVFEHIERNFVAVGIQEDFDRSVDLFCDVLKWEKTFLGSSNVSTPPSSSSITQQAIENILRYNSLDLVLYEEMRKRFYQIVSPQKEV